MHDANGRQTLTGPSRHVQGGANLPAHNYWEGSMKLPRRKFLHLAAGAAALAGLPQTASAQAYPTRICGEVTQNLVHPRRQR
jgi:hypothetical protein